MYQNYKLFSECSLGQHDKCIGTRNGFSPSPGVMGGSVDVCTCYCHAYRKTIVELQAKAAQLEEKLRDAHELELKLRETATLQDGLLAKAREDQPRPPVPAAAPATKIPGYPEHIIALQLYHASRGDPTALASLKTSLELLKQSLQADLSPAQPQDVAWFKAWVTDVANSTFFRQAYGAQAVDTLQRLLTGLEQTGHRP